MIFFLFYFLLSSAVFLGIYIGQLFNKKIYIYLKNKDSTINNAVDVLSKINRTNKKVLIFHAASAGEFEQLKPILKQINRKRYFILQTFSSPTIFNAACNNPLFDICCYHPPDIIWQSYSFFKKINPDAYIVTRHDVWPSHLLITNKLDIKSYYINANIHKKSIWNKKLFIPMSKIIFNNLDLCLVPSERIQNNFMKIISKHKIHITGDSRFDQILNRKNQNKDTAYLPNYYENSFNIIFGSYDEYDTPLMLESLIDYYPHGRESLKKNNHRVILVPHEIDMKDIQKTIKKLKNNHFKSILYSELNSSFSEEYNVLIVDKVGILAELYRYTHLAYVGSGFNDGVHSVIEPAVYGNAISFGPNIELLDEAKQMYKNKLGFMIKNKDDMLNFFELYKQNQLLEKIKNNVIEYVNNNSKASQKIIQWIEKTL